MSGIERLARASASPTRSGPEGSSRNEPRLGRCPASHLSPAYLRLTARLFGARVTLASEAPGRDADLSANRGASWED